MPDKTIIWDERALETVQAMRTRVDQVGTYFGERSPEYAKTAASLGSALGNILMKGFADTARVSRDGELSLYVVEGGFHYGVIFFRDRKYDGDPEVPAPGEWSFHS